MRSSIHKSKPEAITALVGLLRGNYRSLWDKDVETNAGRILGALWEEVGPQRTERAVLDCMREESFFEESNLRKHVPAGKGERPTCARCRASGGFVTVLVDRERVATRCTHGTERDTSVTKSTFTVEAPIQEAIETAPMPDEDFAKLRAKVQRRIRPLLAAAAKEAKREPSGPTPIQEAIENA